jgi:hypothetical protein
MAPACLVAPSTPGGGEALGWGVVWRAGPVDRPVPSAWGEEAGSMGGQAGPSQRESERERGPHTTRYSSELKNQVQLWC